MAPSAITADEPFSIGDWRIDPESNCISRHQEVLRLEPKAMRVLVRLAERVGHVVTRQELEDSVWTEMVVGPDALTNAIIKLRRAMGDDARSPQYIETIPKTGYRLIASVRNTAADEVEPALDRKLAAILYADVAGYSRLTGEDEERTHRVLSARLDLFSGSIQANNGHVVHYAGDAVLAEFPTVTEALGCAVNLQRDLRAEELSHQDVPLLQFRIGINLGEVIVDRDDIYGDGVNIAARLEGLADPGGICISEAVKTAIGHKLPLNYEFLGERTVKNIADPVRAYRVLLHSSATGATLPARRVPMAVLLVAGLSLLAFGGWYFWDRPPPSPERTADAPTVPSVPHKPAIAVLPFANVNVDPEDEYFADGMTHDMITDLAKVSGLYVIARNSVFTYKNQAINVSEVGHELGAQYILEGSIRRTQDRVRINVQLVDATTGRHLWAERYDRSYSEFFALQDEVIAQVVSAVSVTLTDTELTRIERPPTANLKAYDYYLRAEQKGYIGGTRGLRDTITWYAKAIELDPDFAEAHAGLARAAVEMWRNDISDIMSGAEARARAYESAARALELDAANGRAYSVLAVLQLAEGYHDAAVKSARKAVSLGPGDAEAHLDLGLVLAYSGEPERGVESIETALRLNPKPTSDSLVYAGIVFFIDRQYRRSIDVLTRARSAREETEPVWTFLAAAHAQLGETDKAKMALKGLLNSYPAISIEYFRARDNYFRDAAVQQRFLEGLNLAGLPDWPHNFQDKDLDRLSEEDLRAMILDRTWTGKHANGVAFLQEVSASGALAYSSRNSFRTGTVSIRGEQLCQRFGATLDRELCGYIYRNPTGSPETQDEFIAVMPDSLRYFSLAR